MSFLIPSYRLIVAKSKSFILWPVFLMWKSNEAFFVDFEYIKNFEHVWYVNGVVVAILEHDAMTWEQDK